MCVIREKLFLGRNNVTNKQPFPEVVPEVLSFGQPQRTEILFPFPTAIFPIVVDVACYRQYCGFVLLCRLGGVRASDRWFCWFGALVFVQTQKSVLAGYL